MGGITSNAFVRPLRIADELDQFVNDWRSLSSLEAVEKSLNQAEETLRELNTDCPELSAARALVSGPHDRAALSWPISGVANALRRAARTLLGDGSDDDLRVAALMRLDQIRRDAGDGARCGHRDLARDFSCDHMQMKRVAKWLIDRGLVESEQATSGHGMSLELTGDGIDQLREWENPRTDRPSSVDANAAEVASLDFSFVADADIRRVLERNMDELRLAVANDLHTAAIVLVGSTAEGILFDAIMQRKARAMASPKAPKNKLGVMDPADWTFFALIEVAEDLGLFRQTTKQSLHTTVREFRNMIHPKVQAVRGLAPDGPEMRIVLGWLEAVARDVSKAP